MGPERLTLEQAIARYSGWTIYDSDGSRRWLLAPGEAPEELSRAVLLIVEGAWVMVWPVALSTALVSIAASTSLSERGY